MRLGDNISSNQRQTLFPKEGPERDAAEALDSVDVEAGDEGRLAVAGTRDKLPSNRRRCQGPSSNAHSRGSLPASRRTGW
jgi:hypothetical protein